MADTEFSGYTEREGADDGSWAEVGELVAVIAYTLLRAVVAIDEGGVGLPLFGGLVFQFLAFRIVGCDPVVDLLVYCCPHKIGDLTHDGQKFADIIEVAAVIQILFSLLDLRDLVGDVETGCVRGLHDIVEELEGCGSVGGDFGEEFLEEGGGEVGREKVVDDGTGSMDGYIRGGVEVQGPSSLRQRLSWTSIGFRGVGKCALDTNGCSSSLLG